MPDASPVGSDSSPATTKWVKSAVSSMLETMDPTPPVLPSVPPAPSPAEPNRDRLPFKGSSSSDSSMGAPPDTALGLDRQILTNLASALSTVPLPPWNRTVWIGSPY